MPADDLLRRAVDCQPHPLCVLLVSHTTPHVVEFKRELPFDRGLHASIVRNLVRHLPKNVQQPGERDSDRAADSPS